MIKESECVCAVPFDEDIIINCGRGYDLCWFMLDAINAGNILRSVDFQSPGHF